MNMDKRINRNLSIEILRILSMIGIVLLHVQSKTDWLNQFEVGKGGWLGSWGIYACCMTSVNIYVLISGYFLSASKASTKKVFSLWITVFSWGLFLFLFLWAIGAVNVTPDYVIGLIFPFSTRRYWFITVYVAMYLLSPYYNVVLNGLNQRQYRGFIILIVVVFSILPSFIPYGGDDGVIGVTGIGGTNLIWFFVLYTLAAYIRRFGPSKYTRYDIIRCAAMAAIPIVFMLLFQLCMDIVQQRFGFGGSYGTWFFNYASILNCISSVYIFKLFLSFRISGSKILNIIVSFFSKGTLGVYLFHENMQFRPILWDYVVRMNSECVFVLPYTLKIVLISLAIFFTGCILEMLRSLLFRNLFSNKRINCLTEKVDDLLYGEFD